MMSSEGIYLSLITHFLLGESFDNHETKHFFTYSFIMVDTNYILFIFHFVFVLLNTHLPQKYEASGNTLTQ